MTESAGDAPAHRYTAALAGAIERGWQDHWEAHGTFHAPNPTGPLAEDRPLPQDKLFVQDMFPYPSGHGLHVGHPLGFIATDVYARYHRMSGHNVLHTMGFDAFGLPAEQYAVQTGQHPRRTTEDNIERYLAQLRQLGFGHDPRRRISTIDPEYYAWTQWIFLQIYQSWYDHEQALARPIEELVAQFADGTRASPDGRDWAELTAAEREERLARYRLAYVTESPVNWCPALGTVLANEEVTADGYSERGNFPVFRRNLKQWMMRITAYADRLVDDLDRLEWPEKVKAMQRNWIGRSAGATITFPAGTATSGQGQPAAGQLAAGHQSAGHQSAGHQSAGIDVFTTRPDTVFGATYLVLAPEHPMVDRLTTESWPAGVDPRWTGGEATPEAAVASYRRAAARKSELDRADTREKTGVFTGSYATNPASGTEIPIFVADYVLMTYGSGAIMAVPGQDERDWDFAEVFGLAIIRTVLPRAEATEDELDGAYLGDGVVVNSTNERGLALDGLGVEQAKQAAVDWLAARAAGSAAVQYKLRDWLFSRQRYWGEPFPIVYDVEGIPHGLPEEMLPVELPEVTDYAPATYDAEDVDTEPVPPLARATDWVEVQLDLGDGTRPYRRETNTMPNWAGSCWYQLRYIDPTNPDRMCEPENERYWMGPHPQEHGDDDPGGVDLYVGGVEHAVLHLLYARFWHKVLYDLGHVSSEEPYRKLFNQGYIQAYAYTDARGFYVPAEEVVESEGRHYYEGAEVTQEYGKMGKSLRNVVTPDEMAEAYGVDTFRFYEMAMGPLELSRPWATKDVIGAHRFLQRLWRLMVDEDSGELRVSDAEASVEDRKQLHRTIAGVREDYAALRFNTAGAKLIELTNHLTKVYGAAEATPRELAEALVLMVAPITPHIAEELWSKLGGQRSLAHGPFPEVDEAYLTDETVEYPIQLNGKVRARTTVPADADEDAVRAAALAEERIAAALDGGEPRKVIVVPGRMVNVVV